MNWKHAKQAYEKIEIPEELSARVGEALAFPKKEARHRVSWYRPALQIAAACCILFVVLVNSSEVFAKSLYELPVIGTVARIFTFREYRQEDDYNYINVRVPAIQNTGNDGLENRINQEITFKINQVIEESKVHAKEYYEAYIATGSEDNFHPVELLVDYNIYYQSGELLSFVIEKSESFASVFTEKYYYNIDLKYGRELTLHDLLGDGYLENVNEQISNQIREREARDPDHQMFFEGKEGFQGISENQNFYINSEGKIVIVFDRYSIAPGAMGFPEFTVEMPTPYTEKAQN